MSKQYDLVILGGGPGGYVAAKRASQLGLKTAIVEAGRLGGTCLHKGCVPSKSLLRSAEVFATLQNSETYGVTATSIGYDYTKVQQRKQEVVDQLHQGVQYLMKKHQVDVIHGFGRILGPSIFSPVAGTISVEFADGRENEILIPKNVIIATGSKPRVINGLEIDGEYILSSTEALELEQLPESMIILGGGAIGIEWASLLNDFGVQVTLLEGKERLLPLEDEDISKEITRLFKRRKIKVITGINVLPESLQKAEQQVTLTGIHKDKELVFQGDKLLIAVGRQPNTANIGLDNTDIRLSAGAIETDPFGVTKERHIYAIGDVKGGLQLAHLASQEGIVAAEHIAGLQPEPLNELHIPRCVYSRPEVASVGLSEARAKELGYDVEAGQFSFKGIGKALIYGDSSGFVKIVKDQKSDDILGVHMIGPHVSDLISEAGLAMVLDATPWEISRTVHPHPALSEIVSEAAWLLGK